MRLKLFLLLVFTLSSVFSQNTITLPARSNSDFREAGGLERKYSVDNNHITAKSNLLEKHRLWLNMTNTGGAFKQLLIGYIESATNGLDNKFDGISLDANPYLDFYSINSGLNLVIQGRALPFLDTDQVELGYRSLITGSFTIAIDHGDGLLANHPVFLEDKLTNTVHDLRVSGYTFSTESGVFKNRFVLKYKNQSLSTDDNVRTNSNVLVWIDNNRINISCEQQYIEKVLVYTLSGKLIHTANPVSANETNIFDIRRNNELLVMKIILDNNQIKTRKIIY